MPISTCCGAETDMDEIGICPECLEHCDWEDEEEEEPTQEEKQLDADTERAIEEEQINNQNK
jgi:hypothetical protein